MSVPDSSPTHEQILAARDVCRRYGEGEAAVDALAGVSVDFPAGCFPAGRFPAIIGPSGSDKSALDLMQSAG